MAQLGSSNFTHRKFSSGFCTSSQSMAPLPVGYDTGFHQSSVLPRDAAFQIHQQVRQLYLQQQQQQKQKMALQNSRTLSDMDPPPVNDDMDMVPEVPKEDPLDIQSFAQEDMGGASGLMRYHSAPSSTLAGLSGMGDTLMNHDAVLGQLLSNSTLHMESNGAFKHMDTSHSLSNGNGDAAHSGIHVAGVLDHNNCLISPHASFGFCTANGSGDQCLAKMAGVDLKGSPLVRLSSEVGIETSRAPSELPSSHPLRSSYTPITVPSENGSAHARGAPMPKSGLLRHSSSPAGFLAQLNDDNERNILTSSSGNSSEDGNYDRQAGQGMFGNYTWDGSASAMVGSPNASYVARKRIRDLGEKYYTGSTMMDNQKGDVAEHGVLGNYFGMPAATSPDNVYFADKVSPDSTPCRIRAKRGCATHPRSIAERVRRTKISERMKKLQELVPNMDKQTNTAEMLDEALEYVKNLQRQVQELRESQSKCECSCGKQKPTS